MSVSKSQYFDYDKEQLLNALERYDGDTTVEDVTDGANLTYDARHNHTVFLQILLEFYCSTFVRNERHREILLNEICERLADLKILHPSLLMHLRNPIRIDIKQKFFQFVKETLIEVIPNSDIDPEAFSYLENVNISADPNICYYKCFEELDKIGKGGFGVVFKAKDKLTEHVYAVKKIYFKYKNDNCYLQVMREAKNIAALDHPNVVRYYKSWIEIAPSSCDSESSSSSDSDNKNSDNGGYSFSAEDVSAIIMEDDCRSESSGSSRTIESNVSPKSSDQYSNTSSDSVIFASSSKKYSDRISEDSDGTISEKRDSDSDSTAIGDLSFRLNLNICAMLYIQMEYCDCDLRFWLEERAKGNQLPFEMDVTEIFTNILKGVAHIHSKRIIHRDLKPQNIFYSKASHCLKIGDFGLATLVNYSDSHSDSHMVRCGHSSNIGTRPYAAPEQISSKCYDSKVDIYSLGVILIELMNTCSTLMEFSRSITEVKNGKLTEEMKKLPNLASLAPNLISNNPEDRRGAKEILMDFEENTKVKLKEAEKALKEKDLEIRKMNEQLTKLNAVVHKKDKEIKRLRAKLNKLPKQ